MWGFLSGAQPRLGLAISFASLSVLSAISYLKLWGKRNKKDTTDRLPSREGGPFTVEVDTLIVLLLVLILVALSAIR